MEKLSVSFVIEILGRPAENVTDALNSILERISKEKGMAIKEKKIHEPLKIEGENDLFTAFAEVEAELDSLANYFALLFTYMPSHIELINPEKITLQNAEITELANALIQRLHTYDAIAKNYLIEREIFLKKLKELSPETFKKITEYLESQTKGKN